MGEKQFFFSYTVILLQAAYSFHRKGHSYDSRLGIWVKTYQIPHNFLITWPAIRRPATGGTKETLPGMERFEEERASWKNEPLDSSFTSRHALLMPRWLLVLGAEPDGAHGHASSKSWVWHLSGYPTH